MRNELVGNILAVRAVEDTIRASKKYTKFVLYKNGDRPIQGGDFPSRVLTENYEVYPDLDIEQRMPLWDAVMTTSDWLWGDILHIDVSFKYCYQQNKARIIIHGGNGVVKLLEEGIPGFKEVLTTVQENGHQPS